MATGCTTDSIKNISTTLTNNNCLQQIKATTTAALPIEGYSTVKIILISILVIAMVVSNSLIVNAFLTSRRLQKKPSNFLIASQAASDLFTCLVFFPVHVVERYHRRIHVEGEFIFVSTTFFPSVNLFTRVTSVPLKTIIIGGLLLKLSQK